jgi:hypothetical protein
MDKVKQAFTVYDSLSDVGAPYAKVLMRWYVLGLGQTYEVGREFYEKKDWWSGKITGGHRRDHSATPASIGPIPLALRLARSAMLSGPSAAEWDKFMKERIELKEMADSFYKKLTLKRCERAKPILAKLDSGQEFESNYEVVNEKAPHTKLNELESMRATLHGSELITFGSERKVILQHDKDTGTCSCTVEYRWINWTWWDTGNLHSGKKTDMADGKAIDDKDFEDIGVGRPYQIKIHWRDPLAEWHTSLDSEGDFTEPWQSQGWPSLK